MNTPHQEGKPLTPRVALNALRKLGITLEQEDFTEKSLFAGQGDHYCPPTQVRKLNLADIPTGDRYRGFCKVK